MSHLHHHTISICTSLELSSDCKPEISGLFVDYHQIYIVDPFSHLCDTTQFIPAAFEVSLHTWLRVRNYQFAQRVKQCALITESCQSAYDSDWSMWNSIHWRGNSRWSIWVLYLYKCLDASELMVIVMYSLYSFYTRSPQGTPELELISCTKRCLTQTLLVSLREMFHPHTPCTHRRALFPFNNSQSH